MAAVAYFAMRGDPDGEESPELHPFRGWLKGFHRRYFTWIHVTRVFGLAGLVYEVVVDKVDKPSVMIVLGAMILGAESIRNLFGGPR